MDDFRFVIITGMSGAGKTNFMQKLEDMGYYCVDNLPPILIARFADLCWKSTSNTRHVAVVTDIRGGSFFDALPQALKELEKRGIPHEVVFLEASDEALVRRYMETRRQHPLAKTMRIQDGIEQERKILTGVRAQADIIIDTTTMKTEDLKEHLNNRFGSLTDRNRLCGCLTCFASCARNQKMRLPKCCLIIRMRCLALVGSLPFVGSIRQSAHNA